MAFYWQPYTFYCNIIFCLEGVLSYIESYYGTLKIKRFKFIS